jgi:hypothetical protein
MDGTGCFQPLLGVLKGHVILHQMPGEIVVEVDVKRSGHRLILGASVPAASASL